MTQIQVIRPYKYHGQWVFDDDRTCLFREPFVAGADTILDIATRDIPNAKDGFLLLFSRGPFPGYQIHVTWVREEMEGNVYHWAERDAEGWLSPALMKYFVEAPKDIYFQAKPVQ